MQITRLRISGFKSFSDPIELGLEGGLTGVVGPNGCGKSNIVEALRWAMGESSARGLRGDEMDDVIFNGTGARAAHDVAEVRLKVRGRAEGLAGLGEVADLEVSRKLARGVGSTYRINGKEARARDVQLLFQDAGAGARSPAIVGQGQIGFIVDAKASERRRLLEDAAGIGGLQTRRREAELKLEATRANLHRVRDLLQAQEARLAELKRQGRQAERYRRLAADLRRAESLLLLARHAAADATAQNARVAVERAAAALEADVAAAAGLRRSRELAAAALPPVREAATGGGAEAARLRGQLESRRAVAGREAAQIEALQQRCRETDADLARTEHAAADLERAASAAAMAIEAALARRGARAGELAAAEAAALAAAPSMEAAQAALRAAVAAGAGADAQAAAAEAHLASLAARREALARELAPLPSPASAQATRGAAESDVARQLAALTDARAALAAADAELQALALAREAEQAAHHAAERAPTEAGARLAAAELRLREAQAAADRLGERGCALTRAAGRLAERQEGHDVRGAALDRTVAEADVAARGNELAAAETALRAADARVDVARAAAAAAEHARGDATELSRELHRHADALAAEIRVLETLVPADAARRVLDAVEVPEALAAALAAALGDDLLAATDVEAGSHWRELEAPPGHERPPLPPGAMPLGGLVRAPAVLAARLGQVGLVGAAAGAGLQPALLTGQRLVSREGDLWRWDGMVRAAEGEEAGAARVRHRLRLHAACDEAAGLDARIAAAIEALSACEASLAAARAGLSAAEGAWRAADTAQLRARGRMDEAGKLKEREAEERRRLEAEAAVLHREAEEIATERAELVRLAGECPDLTALRAEVEQERAGLEAAQAGLQAAGVSAARAAARYGEAVSTARTRGQAVEIARAALDAARAEAERAGLLAGELEAAHRARTAQLEADADRLAGELAAAREQAAAAAEAVGSCELTRAAAEAAAMAADASWREASERLAACQAELAALDRETDRQRHQLAEMRRQEPGLAATRAELAARAERLHDELAVALRERQDEPGELERLAAAADAAEGRAAAARREQEAGEAELSRLECQLERAAGVAAAAREALVVAQAEAGHAAAAARDAAAAVEDRLQQPPAALLKDDDTSAALAAAELEALEAEVPRLRTARDRLGPVNLRAEVEVAELETALGDSRGRQGELQAAVERLDAAIATLDKEGRERLMGAFTAVDAHFRRLFVQLFGGGRAHLRLTGADDPLHAGLELEASPPGKKLASISLLSGGEKTLTALALVFGFFLAQPSPLCILDEVDAPLDDANVDRFVSLMREIEGGTGTRFLVVTHHPLTMARMDRLFGVTMAERGVSRLVSVALEQALELRATA